MDTFNVTHLCGHVQDLTGTLIHRVVSKEKKLLDILASKGKDAGEFVEEQLGFLRRNYCPGCYNQKKIENPSLKPF